MVAISAKKPIFKELNNTANAATDPQKVKNSIRFLTLISAFLLGLSYLPALSAENKSENKNARPSAPVTIQTAQVQKSDLPVQVKAIGTVVPFRTVAVSARVDSQIQKVNFKDGDLVKEGDVLFTLDARTINAQLAQAKADLAREMAQVDTLKKIYDRNVALVKQDAVSQQAVDESKAALDTQMAAVAASKAAVESQSVLLDYTNIKSPITGHTGIVNSTEGNNVKANDTNPLVTINQTQPIYVQFSLPQDSFDAVRGAMQKGDVSVAAARAASATKPVNGKISYINNTIDQGTGTFLSRAVFANEDDALWPGMLVNVTINTDTVSGALSVPDVAIQTAPDGQFVFTIIDGKAKKTPVTVSRMQNGIAIISKGVNAGDIVAIDGLLSLKDGSAVKIAPAGDEKTDKTTP